VNRNSSSRSKADAQIEKCESETRVTPYDLDRGLALLTRWALRHGKKERQHNEEDHTC
jgi:hypothetical protein